MFNRLARMLLFGGLMMSLGWAGRSLVAHRPRAVAALYLVEWVGFYAVYFAGHEG